MNLYEEKSPLWAFQFNEILQPPEETEYSNLRLCDHGNSKDSCWNCYKDKKDKKNKKSKKVK